MNHQIVNNWIKSFVTAWKNHSNAEILKMFDEVENYYEGPFSPSVSSREDIEKLWADVEFQNIEALEVNLIALDGDHSAMHWYLKYTDVRDRTCYEMDGTYEVHFNQNGKCKYFKQWWVMAE